MTKKIFCLLLAGIMLFGTLAFAEGETEAEKLISTAAPTISLTIGEPTIVFEGDIAIPLDVAPCIVNDRTMVPLRAISEMLGAAVEWDDEKKVVFVLREDIYIALQIGQGVMFKNSERIELDAPAVIINDRTMIPVRAIAEGYGCTVGYDEATKTVTITK